MVTLWRRSISSIGRLLTEIMMMMMNLNFVCLVAYTVRLSFITKFVQMTTGTNGLLWIPRHEFGIARMITYTWSDHTYLNKHDTLKIDSHTL